MIRRSGQGEYEALEGLYTQADEEEIFINLEQSPQDKPSSEAFEADEEECQGEDESGGENDAYSTTSPMSRSISRSISRSLSRTASRRERSLSPEVAVARSLTEDMKREAERQEAAVEEDTSDLDHDDEDMNDFNEGGKKKKEGGRNKALIDLEIDKEIERMSQMDLPGGLDEATASTAAGRHGGGEENLPLTEASRDGSWARELAEDMWLEAEMVEEEEEEEEMRRRSVSPSPDDEMVDRRWGKGVKERSFASSPFVKKHGQTMRGAGAWTQEEEAAWKR